VIAAASIGIAVITIGSGIYSGSSVFASHSFEAGVAGSNIPQNTYVRLDGLTVPPGGVLPIYDASELRFRTLFAQGTL